MLLIFNIFNEEKSNHMFFRNIVFCYRVKMHWLLRNAIPASKDEKSNFLDWNICSDNLEKIRLDFFFHLHIWHYLLLTPVRKTHFTRTAFQQRPWGLSRRLKKESKAALVRTLRTVRFAGFLKEPPCVARFRFPPRCGRAECWLGPEVFFPALRLRASGQRCSQRRGSKVCPSTGKIRKEDRWVACEIGRW